MKIKNENEWDVMVGRRQNCDMEDPILFKWFVSLSPEAMDHYHILLLAPGLAGYLSLLDPYPAQ